MRDLQDFNDPIHRIQSASAVFQRGIYHLFILDRRADCDVYSSVVRSYQAIFQLCLTTLLLDFTHPLTAKGMPKRLRALCANGDAPTGAEIDPAAVVTHSVFEERKWPGPPQASPFRSAALKALDLIERVVESRHNLIYRPFLLDRAGLHWEDCSLLRLLPQIPEPKEIRTAYEEFIDAVLLQRSTELQERESLHRLIRESPDEARELLASSEQRYANYFVELQFWPYADKTGVRPTETILLTYGRTLSNGDERFLEALRDFRNRLLRLAYIQPPINFEPDWKLGRI